MNSSDKQLIKSSLLSRLFSPLSPSCSLSSPPHAHWRLVDCRFNFVFSFLSTILDEMIFTSGSCYFYRDTTNFAGGNKDSPAARTAAIPAQSAQPGAIIRRNSRTARPSRCFSSRCGLAPPTAAPVSTEERDRRKEQEDQKEERDRGKGRREERGMWKRRNEGKRSYIQ